MAISRSNVERPPPFQRCETQKIPRSLLLVGRSSIFGRDHGSPYTTEERRRGLQRRCSRTYRNTNGPCALLGELGRKLPRQSPGVVPSERRRIVAQGSVRPVPEQFVKVFL